LECVERSRWRRDQAVSTPRIFIGNRPKRSWVCGLLFALLLVFAPWQAFAAAPTVTSVSPNQGPVPGGTVVVIIGTGFTGATGVTFGSASATYQVDSDTQVTATSPGNSAGTVSVKVTTGAGTSAGGVPTRFTYVARPTVTTVSPGEGPVAGGTSVVITGTNFTDASGVTFGSAAALFTVDSDTQITATSPGNSAGQVAIAVTTTGGTSATDVSTRFTYIARPVVSSVAPAEGPVSGGTSVVITGSKLTGATSVSFGAGEAADFNVDSDTQITATSPGGSAGATAVRVTTTGGTSDSGDFSRFTYIARPVVTSLSTTAGPVAGGTSVVIAGSHFTGATNVAFGSSDATFTVDSDTQITATSPGNSAGAVGVRVTTTGGTSDSGDFSRFAYVARPVVTSVDPPSGPVAGGGGTTVTITGSHFTGATQVTFGSSDAKSFTLDSDTQITAVSPANSAGAVAVLVTTADGGTSAGGELSRFTYIGRPIVSSVSPAEGPVAGGTVVVLTGSRFTDATEVSFGGTAAATFTVDSDTQITATSPAGAAGPIAVNVTTAVGQSSNTAGTFTYVLPAGTLTIRVLAAGGDGVFAFTSTTADLNLSVATSAGAGASPPISLVAGTYRLTMSDSGSGPFGLTSVSCDDGDSTGDLAARSATIHLDADEAVTCTFESRNSRDETTALISDFLQARADIAMSGVPDAQRRIARLMGTAPSPPDPASALMGFLPSLAGNSGPVRLSGSLAALEAWRGNGSSRGDLWFDSTFGHFDKSSLAGLFWRASVGADYLLTERMLVGGFLEADTIANASNGKGGTIGGSGWLVGPYATVRLGDHVFLDVTGGAGGTNGTITPSGTYTNAVDGWRWFGSIALSGSWTNSAWSLSPTARFTYYEEQTRPYIDGLGVAIPGVRVGTGQVEVGPRLSHTITLEGGTAVETSIEFNGLMGFGTAATALRGRFEAGLGLGLAGGGELHLTGSYDGSDPPMFRL
jgi:hypothetical protein